MIVTAKTSAIFILYFPLRLCIVARLARMDAVKRDDFWRSLQLYWDYGIEGGLFGAQHVGDLVEQARDASGDGTTELVFVLCGIPPNEPISTFNGIGGKRSFAHAA